MVVDVDGSATIVVGFVHIRLQFLAEHADGSQVALLRCDEGRSAVIVADCVHIRTALACPF